MILSSRCGRGRLTRIDNNFSRLRASDCRTSSSLFSKCLRRLRDRVTLDQNIFPAKFILRIASFRRVAMRLNAEVKFENIRVVAQRVVDFFFGPNVKRAFAFSVAALYERRSRLPGSLGGHRPPLQELGYRHLPRKRIRPPSTSCRARRNREYRARLSCVFVDPVVI